MALVPLAATLSGCYATRQVWYQGRLLQQRQTIRAALDDSATPADVRQRLEDVPGLIDFARSFGLTPGDSYKSYIDNGDRPISWLVYAAYPDRLELKTWWFPFVGRVPYLGFFSRSEREAQAAKFVVEGYDVAKGSVSAFSMLGFMADPVYRSMTRRSRVDFAHLLFHELVHRTVWIKGSVAFNEQFAEIFSQRMTLAWLDSRSELDAKSKFLVSIDDQAVLANWAYALREALRDLYATKLPAGQMQAQKRALIARFVTEKRPTFKAEDLIAGRTWNNASLLAAQLYEANSFRCSLTAMTPDHGKMLIDWAIRQKDSGISTNATLEKICQ